MLKFHPPTLILPMILFVFLGCATFPVIEPEEIPGRIYSPSTAQITFNRTIEDDFLSELMNRLFPPNFQKTLLETTEKMYIVLYPEAQGGGYFLAAQGTYSKRTIDLALTFKREWKKRGTLLKYWENQKNRQQISLWSQELLLISLGRMEEAQERLGAPHSPLLPMPEPSEAPLSVLVPNPLQFKEFFPQDYPELTDQIKIIALNCSSGGINTVSLGGTIRFQSEDSAREALRPFKLFLMAAAKKEGLPLVKKLISESVVERRRNEITFSEVPLAKEPLTALLTRFFASPEEDTE